MLGRYNTIEDSQKEAQQNQQNVEFMNETTQRRAENYQDMMEIEEPIIDNEIMSQGKENTSLNVIPSELGKDDSKTVITMF